MGLSPPKKRSSFATGLRATWTGQWFLPVCGFAAVLVASSICLDGVTYKADMVVSAGYCSGLPEFRQITQVVAVHTEIMFVCRVMSAWYHEHLRSYEVCYSDVTPPLCVVPLSEHNKVFPFQHTELVGNKW